MTPEASPFPRSDSLSGSMPNPPAKGLDSDSERGSVAIAQPAVALPPLATYAQRHPVTPRQLEVLACIEAQTRLRGIAPSYLDLGGALGIRSGNRTWELVDRLCALGLIEHAAGTKRALYVTAAGHEALAARKWKFLPVEGGKVLDACA